MDNKNHWQDIQGDADDYDGLIARLIPCYREQNDLMINLVRAETEGPLKVLDLGGGTGTLALLIQKSFPNSNVTILDISEKMLEVCKVKLRSYREITDFIRGDFSTDDIGSDYDLVISGLAIHHLVDKVKKDTYKKIFDSLKPGGTFLNRDIVLGATPALTKAYETLWKKFMISNGEDADIWFDRYLEEDIPTTVEKQIDWLKIIGFEEVGCHYQYFNFAIFGGRKRIP